MNKNKLFWSVLGGLSLFTFITGQLVKYISKGETNDDLAFYYLVFLLIVFLFSLIMVIYKYSREEENRINIFEKGTIIGSIFSFLSIIIVSALSAVDFSGFGGLLLVTGFGVGIVASFIISIVLVIVRGSKKI
jgi:heme/copper-type cytochrome/quinol oxidase subunit 2